MNTRGDKLIGVRACMLDYVCLHLKKFCHGQKGTTAELRTYVERAINEP
jgi:hypothetical protein